MGQPPPLTDKALPSLLSLKIDPPDQLVENPAEVVLPPALEELLALKNIREFELGTEEAAAESAVTAPEREPLWEKDDNVENIVENESQVDNNKNKDNTKVSRNKKKKKRKKNRKNKQNEEKELEKSKENEEVEELDDNQDVEIVYVFKYNDSNNF